MSRPEKLRTLFSSCFHKQILYGTWVRGVAFYIILPVYFHERTSNLYVTSKHNLFVKMCIYKLSPLALVELILHTS